jgi:PKD repeat protein
MGVSSGVSVSASKAIALTAVAVVAIAIILFVSNITITNAQQQQQPPTISQPSAQVTQNGTTMFQSTEDGIRMMVPEGWIIDDVNNTGSTFSEESRQGYGILAQLCPQEQGQAALSNVSSGGGNTAHCQGSGVDIIHIVRYPDLDARLQAAANNITTTTNNNNMTIDNILLYHMQKLEQVGYRGMEIMDNTNTTLNVTNAQTNQTITTVPAKNVEMTYNTTFAPNESRTGYFILTATNETAPSRGMTKGYSIFYEGLSTTAEMTTTSSGSLVPRPLPQAVKQVFDSFELVTEVPTVVAAEQQPLTVDITSSDTEGGEIAPATFEFEANVSGGTGPYTYSWDFGDDDDSSEEGSDEQTISHTFEEDGTYNVRLTVTDSSGQSASDSVEITVDEPPATAAAPAEEVVEEDEEPPTDEVPPGGGVFQPPETGEEGQPPGGEEEGEEPNDAGSDDGFDVGEFVDDLFDRLGVR